MFVDGLWFGIRWKSDGDMAQILNVPRVHDARGADTET